MAPLDKQKSYISKYMSFFRIKFIAGLQYRAAALAGIATQFAWGFMKILLYKTFYSENPDTFPMTIQAVSSYIWLHEAFFTLFMICIFDNEIFHMITGGGIAYEMCRPVDIYNMWFVRNIANRISKVLLRAVPILLVAVFLKEPYGLKPPAGLHAGIWFLITTFLGLLVAVAVCMLIYILTFFTMSPAGIRIIFLGLSEFFTGSAIPLPFLPKNIRLIVELMPLASIQNVPLRIYSGDIHGSEIYEKALLQLFWLIVLVIFGRKLVGKAERRIIVQGG